MVDKELIHHDVVPPSKKEFNIQEKHHWYHSITGKVAVYLMLGVLIAYSVGSGAGFFEVKHISHEQWFKQTATHSQITRYIIRKIYTSVSVKSNSEGLVIAIESERPLWDDENMIPTGFNPADILALVSTQTHNPTWLFYYDEKHGFIDRQTKQKTTTTDDEAGNFALKEYYRGFATLNGKDYFVGSIPSLIYMASSWVRWSPVSVNEMHFQLPIINC